MAKQKDVGEIEVLEIQTGKIEVCILGKTPLIIHRLSQKAMRELLLPKGKKTAADKASSLKHEPLTEYRASAHVSSDDKAPTRLLMPTLCFKGALRSVATDMPGAAKTQIGRLTYVEGMYVPIYGIPKLIMSITRSSDMNRTPDIRTRCIVPEWATRLTVAYVKPLLKEQTVANLLAAAGIMRGVGDWRPEKGSSTFGQFELCAEDDPNYQRILKSGCKDQDAALESPDFYDDESRELYEWGVTETKRRGFKAVV